MSLIKWNRNRDQFPSMPSFFDNIGWDEDFLNAFWNGRKMPAVNISETDESFLLELAAPGMQKTDFKIHVKDGLLNVTAEKSESTEEENKNYRRQEYSFRSFSRSFQLPENVNTNEVKANYEEGVLKIHLGKKEVEAPQQLEVKVS